MLGLGIFGAGELEETRGWYQASAAAREVRPSDRKLNTGPPFAPLGAKLKFIGTSSTSFPAPRITGAMSLIRSHVRLWQIELGLLHRNPELEILHHLAVLDPADMLFVSVAHKPMIATPPQIGVDWGVLLRSRAVGSAEAPRRGSSPSRASIPDAERFAPNGVGHCRLRAAPLKGSCAAAW
jgi:hypothetical protein